MDTYFRHGDVHIVAIDSIPKDAKATKETVLEYGELTGHAHRLDEGEATIYMKAEKKYLRVVQPTNLRHEEHHTKVIPPGDYEIRRTLETDHMTRVIRQIAD